MHRRLSDDKRAEILRLLATEPPLKHAAIAAQVGCTPAMVSKVALASGQARSRGRKASGRREEIAKLRALGMSLRAIAAEIGVSKQYVSRSLSDGEKEK